MPEGLIERLAAENIHVAPRVGRMRISPHVYNDEEDVDRFVATFSRLAALAPADHAVAPLMCPCAAPTARPASARR